MTALNEAVCVACEDNPAPCNNPCAVCGKHSNDDVPVAWIRKDRTHVDLHKHPGYIPCYIQQPVPLIDQVIKALSEYCETGEIDCADDLLAAVCYEKDFPRVEAK